MSRVLKFRAWDKRQKKFLHPWPNGFHLFGETTCFDTIGQQLAESKNPGQSQFDRLNDAEVTQYTGLKDRNGKEIWEGDVVIHSTDETLDDSRGEVVYRPPSFMVYHPKDEVLTEFALKSTEVLGNVYENPKLLESKHG